MQGPRKTSRVRNRSNQLKLDTQMSNESTEFTSGCVRACGCVCNARSKIIIVSRTNRTNQPKIWKNSKNTKAQPKLSGSYKKKSVIILVNIITLVISIITLITIISTVIILILR